MAYEKDPNELGSIFVSAGKGQYENVEFFGGKSFDIPNGMYILESFSGVSKKTNRPFKGIKVVRVADNIQQPAADPPPGFWDSVDTGKAPF